MKRSTYTDEFKAEAVKQSPNAGMVCSKSQSDWAYPARLSSLAKAQQLNWSTTAMALPMPSHEAAS